MAIAHRLQQRFEDVRVAVDVADDVVVLGAGVLAGCGNVAVGSNGAPEMETPGSDRGGTIEAPSLRLWASEGRRRSKGPGMDAPDLTYLSKI